jgi:hypothetical protein
MLAPINAPTGDGRRFASGGLTAAPTPFPFEWARERDMGHDGAVVVGAVQEAHFATVARALDQGWVSQEAVTRSGLDHSMEAIWAVGEIFDDVDREEMPRLAEDVAEAVKLISEGVLGPSVDLDSFEGIPVREGTDQEITWEDLEEAEENGEEVKVELLVTEGRVRAATLVSIPAFQETSHPLELMEPDEDEEPDEAAAARTAALVASVSAPVGPPAVAFDAPELAGPTQVTFDWEAGRVYGHIAVWGTCHGGFPDVCITPPKDPGGDYSWFHRYPVDTQDGGVVWAGRLTVGGRHPGLNLTASATMAAYDGKTVAADVRMYEDVFGIAVAGPIRPDLDDASKRILARRRVSGDWRETSDGLSLIEVLALSPGPRQHAEPGFPVATRTHNGRQVALTAALGPDQAVQELKASATAEVRAALKVEREREQAAAELRRTLEVERQAAIAKLAEALEIPAELLEVS